MPKFYRFFFLLLFLPSTFCTVEYIYINYPETTSDLFKLIGSRIVLLIAMKIILMKISLWLRNCLLLVWFIFSMNIINFCLCIYTYVFYYLFCIYILEPTLTCLLFQLTKCKSQQNANFYIPSTIRYFQWPVLNAKILFMFRDDVFYADCPYSAVTIFCLFFCWTELQLV